MAFENNVVTGFVDHTESASCNHIDGLQWYSGPTAGTGGVTLHRQPLLRQLRLRHGVRRHRRTTRSPTTRASTRNRLRRSLLRHRIDHQPQLMQTGGADPGDCNTMHDASAPIQSCNNSARYSSTATKAATEPRSGETSPTTSRAGAPNVDIRLPLHQHQQHVVGRRLAEHQRHGYARRRAPSDHVGRLRADVGIDGHAGGSDGLGCGHSRRRGRTANGRRLRAREHRRADAQRAYGRRADGLNNERLMDDHRIRADRDHLPMVRLPELQLLASGCTPIQPQTAPTSANSPTYTLQASDVGKYVFSEVTVTNANGQVNAVSNAAGPVA